MTDSDSGTLSQEEIAQQFLLPERQVKVNQLLKAMNVEADPAIYCICRSSDCNSFMIGCDSCNEWFHGACIGVTEQEADHIKHFYCQFCREKNSELKHHKKSKDHEKHKKSDPERHKKHSQDKERHRKLEQERGKHKKKDGEKTKKLDVQKHKREDQDKPKKSDHKKSEAEKVKRSEQEREKIRKDHDKDKHKKSEIDRDRIKKSDGDREKIKKADPDRDKKKADIDRDKIRKSDPEREKKKTDVDREKIKKLDSDKDKPKKLDTDRDRQKKLDTDRDKHKKSDTDKDKQKKTEVDKDKKKSEHEKDKQRKSDFDKEKKKSDIDKERKKIDSDKQKKLDIEREREKKLDLEREKQRKAEQDKEKQKRLEQEKEKQRKREQEKQRLLEIEKERQLKIEAEQERVKNEEKELQRIAELDVGQVMRSVDEERHLANLEKEVKKLEQYDTDHEKYKKPSHPKEKHKQHSDHKERVRNSSGSGKKKSSRRCGECVSCHRQEDCSRCDFCKDMKKFGGMNKMRQKCRLRQCLNFGLSKQKAAMQAALLAAASTTESEHTMYASDEEMDYSSGEEYSSARGTPKSPRDLARSESEFSTPGKGRMKTNKGKKDKKKTKKKEKKKVKQKSVAPITAGGKRRRLFEDEEPQIEAVEELPRQCYGPGCVEPARQGSKYCSDECGLKLATNRIFEILPKRIQAWQSKPCVAEENNKVQLEKIRMQQLLARQRLVELDVKNQHLDGLIERVKQATIAPQQDATDDEDDPELSVYCVTCGHEVRQRTAIKHMETCFAKYESLTSYGSIYKSRIEGNSMFCDYYNSQSKTYCKRLKVLCPEHSRDPKVGPDEVCGCPLVTNVFEDTGEICQAAKRKCYKHYHWQKLRRAEIDMERVRQWMKLDELFENERNIRLAMASRAGVLGLMLHHAIDHDPMNPIKLPTGS